MKTQLALIATAAGLAFAFAAAHADDVYKWTDAQGVTHYGDKPPADGKTAAKSVDTHTRALTAEEQDAADAKLAESRAHLSSPAQATTPAPAAKPKAAPTAPPLSECAAQWKEYNDDVRCWDPRHIYGADRAAHPERYTYCMQMKHGANGMVAPMCPEPH